MKLGAIEAGGTKFVVCIGNEKGEVLERESFPTEAPEKTMENVFKFFDGKEIEALGVGSFGPIDPDLTSPTYGYITTTPKPGWNNYNIMGALKERYDIPMAFDTDVNGLPLSLIVSWYEQKAVADLLALLSLGIKNIYLGPTLPAFLSPNVLQYLVDTFQLRLISNPEDDIKTCLGQAV